jgi:hypothetical protein
VPFHLRPRFQNRDWLGQGFPWSLADPAPEYARGDCPVAEALCEQEWQIKASFHEDVPELMAQITVAIAKVGDAADAIAEAASRGALPQT